MAADQKQQKFGSEHAVDGPMREQHRVFWERGDQPPPVRAVLPPPQRRRRWRRGPVREKLRVFLERYYRDQLNAADVAAEAATMRALLVRLGGEAAAAPKTGGAKRCSACRKKVGLLGFACRCGGAFCSAHRQAEAHACGFDYKKAGRKHIAEENPVVVAPKIARI